MKTAGIDEIQILTTVPHSSLSKAASILGLGRTSVKTIGLPDAPHRFNMDSLRSFLAHPGCASIVAISASEVNTGLFATASLSEMQEIRRLCDMYGAWIHVDGAFGLFARMLSPSTPTTRPLTNYDNLIAAVAGIELADSLTGDLHKVLNVPYDSGFFLSRHANLAARVFQNPNAAYLATSSASDGIMSPLNIGLENSRRFRALPVYATLVAYGRDGYRSMLERQIASSRNIAMLMIGHPDFELLPVPPADMGAGDLIMGIFIIVLFRAKDPVLNSQLVDRIKATRKIYVSGTSWEGAPACRFAVSNWMVDVKRDTALIGEVLESVVKTWASEGGVVATMLPF
ncbi:hypothetical protein NX059_003104 [Plenodomus lindquistii]|nr:hypothetical protein NX059_003104 [Plenodomus lindquistii]